MPDNNPRLCSDAPLITFCIPVFNESKFIRFSVQSLLVQSFPNLLVYISDNASTDETVKVCKQLAASDARITLFTQPKNIGAAANLAFLVNNCRTPYLAFVAGHDFLSPDYLSTLLLYYEQYPTASLVYSQMSAVDGNGNLINESCGDSIDTRNRSPWASANLIQSRLYGNMCYGIYRTSALKSCHINVACRGADHVLIQELSLLGPLIHHPEPLYMMRNMAGINRKQGMSYDDFCRSQLKRIDPTFFDKSPRRIHWHWFFTTLYCICLSRASLSTKMQALPSAGLAFLRRWSRYLIRDIIKPLSA